MYQKINCLNKTSKSKNKINISLLQEKLISLGGVLVLTSSNKDKQEGVTMVVQERREETREKRREGWKRSSGEFEIEFCGATEDILKET